MIGDHYIIDNCEQQEDDICGTVIWASEFAKKESQSMYGVKDLVGQFARVKKDIENFSKKIIILNDIK
jgi:hypothetical protein